MKITYLGSDLPEFLDCTVGKGYKAKMQHIGDRDDDGWEVCEDDQVSFVDDAGDLVCKHISIIREAFTVEV